MMATGKIAFGLGIVENAYDETAIIEAVAPEQFEQREEALLVQARDMLPRLPVRKADLLIVDRIGKDISGSGIDTNVAGRKRAFRDMPLPAGHPGDALHLHPRPDAEHPRQRHGHRPGRLHAHRPRQGA